MNELIVRVQTAFRQFSSTHRLPARLTFLARFRRLSPSVACPLGLEVLVAQPEGSLHQEVQTSQRTCPAPLEQSPHVSSQPLAKPEGRSGLKDYRLISNVNR